MTLSAAVLAAAKLCTTDATGAEHHAIINISKRRIIMRRIGRYNELWDDAMALEAPRSSEGNKEEYRKAYNIRRTTTLAQEGAYGKATQAIQSAGILPPSTEVANALSEKHLQDTPSDDLKYALPPDMPAPRPRSDVDVRNAIKYFPFGSAAGGSGLRPNHIYELSKVEDSSRENTIIGA